MKPTLDRDDIRRRALALIEANGWKNKTASDFLGVSETTIARMAANEIRWANMSRATVERIADHVARLEAAAESPEVIMPPPLDEPAVIDTATPAPEPTLPVAGMLAEVIGESRDVTFGGHLIRMIVAAGDEPWFVLADVCAALGISDHRSTSQRLDLDEKGVALVHSPGGMQFTTVVNEGGFYRAVMRSDKPTATQMTKWVAHVVLPSIRKTGGYVQSAPAPVDQIATLAATTNHLAQVLGAGVIEAKRVADDAMVIAQAAPAAALGLLKQERDEAAKLRRVLERRVATLVDEALSRGFYGGNKRKAFQDVNGDIADKHGTRDGMSSDALRLAIAYVDERHARLTSPNRLDLGASA